MFKKLTSAFAASSLALVCAAIQPAAASASDGGTLFAVFGETQIVALDPSTGSMTTLADLTDPSVQFGNTISDLVSDSAHHRLLGEQTRFNFDPNRDPAFFETDQIVSVDTRSGAVTISPDVPQRLILAFDSSTGTLFGLTSACCPYQVFKIDPGTGAETLLASIAGDAQISTMAVAPALHVIYIVQRTPNVFPPTGTLLAIDTVSGAISTGPALDRGIVNLAYDSSSGTLYGKTFTCCGAAQLLRINTNTGAETALGSFNVGFMGNSLTIDPSTHRIFFMEDELEAFGFFQQVGTVDPRAGTLALSPQIPMTGYIRSLAFAAVVVTADAVIAELNAAIASGAITNGGIATALLSELNAGKAAQARGQCTAALGLYRAFVNEVTAQSGKSISAATAAQLAADAQAVTCP